MAKVKKHLSDVTAEDLILKFMFVDRAGRQTFAIHNLLSYHVGNQPVGELRVHPWDELVPTKVELISPAADTTVGEQLELDFTPQTQGDK